MDQEQPVYLAYMLRLRRASSAGQSVWRASVESPHTGERRNFAGLEALFEFLRQQTETPPPADRVKTFDQTSE